MTDEIRALVERLRVAAAWQDGTGLGFDLCEAADALERLAHDVERLDTQYTIALGQRDTAQRELADRTLANTQLTEQAQKMYDDRETLRRELAEARERLRANVKKSKTTKHKHQEDPDVCIWAPKNNRLEVLLEDKMLKGNKGPKHILWCGTCGAIKLQSESNWRSPKP